MTGRAPLGAPPAQPWRRSARLLVLDPAERILLLRATDPGWPEQGPWWELPGGGIEDGEDIATAACREVREETGYAVPVEMVGPVQWRGAVVDAGFSVWC